MTIAGSQLKLYLYFLLATEYFLDHGLQEHSGSLKIDLHSDYMGLTKTPTACPAWTQGPAQFARS